MPIITDLTNPNKKQVCHMDEIQKRKVVQHNDLISSVAKMDKIPLKIFELAVSCIDTEVLLRSLKIKRALSELQIS